MRSVPSNGTTAESHTITRVGPGSRWMALNLREIWSSRELLYFFVWRDLKVRYRQTAFGALWAIIQPLTMMVVFTAVFGRVAELSPAGTSYALFTLVALVPWTLFAQGLVRSSNSLVDAAEIIKRVYFPRILLPLASVGSYVIDFLIGLAMLIAVLLVSQTGLTPTALWVAPFTVLAIGATLAFGIWFSAVNVRYRDVRYAVPFLVQVWLFASPVAYSAELVPEELAVLYHLNPMAGVIEGFRWSLLAPESTAPVPQLLVSATITLLVLTSGLYYFRRVERRFADVI